MIARKHKSKCDLINKSIIYREKGTKENRMTSEVTINLNILGIFLKNKVVSNLSRTLVVIIHQSETRKRNSYIDK